VNTGSNLVAAILPGGERAFFDGSNAVKSCRMAMYFMAAASCQPPYLSALPRHSFRDKKNGGFDFKSHRSPNGHDYRLLYDGFFLLPSCGRFMFFYFLFKASGV